MMLTVLRICDDCVCRTGPFTVIGRSIMVHEGEDDLGKGTFSQYYIVLSSGCGIEQLSHIGYSVVLTWY